MSNITKPLYVTAIGADGKFMLGGIFRMQDEVGFPLDASFEEIKSLGFHIDWLEALCDCWLNDCLKFDSFVRQAENCTGANLLDKFKTAGAVVVAMFPKIKAQQNPVDVACRYILAKKRKGIWNLEKNPC